MERDTFPPEWNMNQRKRIWHMNCSELIVSCCGCGTFKRSEPISCGWPPPPGPQAAPVPPSPAALVQVGLRFCRENVLLVAGKEKIKRGQLPFTLWICVAVLRKCFLSFLFVLHLDERSSAGTLLDLMLFLDVVSVQQPKLQRYE